MELVAEIAAVRWEEEPEVERYRKVQELVRSLIIECEFAMGGASNTVFLAGRQPEQRQETIDVLDEVINRASEEGLRRYRTRLRHL